MNSNTANLTNISREVIIIIIYHLYYYKFDFYLMKIRKNIIWAQLYNL